MKLSPLSLSSLIANDARAIVNGRAAEVTSWKCEECTELHDTESAALECCSSKLQGRMVCPLCLCTDPDSYQAAVDCCLWKDIDAPTRWQIATRVERGADWADAIKGSMQ